MCLAAVKSVTTCLSVLKKHFEKFLRYDTNGRSIEIRFIKVFRIVDIPEQVQPDCTDNWLSMHCLVISSSAERVPEQKALNKKMQ